MENEKDEKENENEKDEWQKSPLEKGWNTFEFKFERPDVKQGTTYFDTAKLIQQLDVNDPEWLTKTGALIKRFTHHDKLSVYNRIYRYTEKGTHTPSYIQEFLEDKIETHRTLYEVMSKEIEGWGGDDDGCCGCGA